jgi:hypothetical protein
LGMSLVLVTGFVGTAMGRCPGVIYIAVSRAGEVVSVNDESVAPADLPARLADLKTSAQAVWYYREQATSDPTDDEWAKMRAVLDAIMATQLPISFSSRADFSDYVDGNGNSQPRPPCEIKH